MRRATAGLRTPPSATGSGLGPPAGEVRPLPRPSVGLGEPRLLGLGIDRGVAAAFGAMFGFVLDGQIPRPLLRIRRKPVDEQQGELLVGPAGYPDVHVGRSPRIGRAVNPLAPQCRIVAVVVF